MDGIPVRVDGIPIQKPVTVKLLTLSGGAPWESQKQLCIETRIVILRFIGGSLESS